LQSGNKRRKELARLEHRKEKEAKRAERKREKAERPAWKEGDPDPSIQFPEPEPVAPTVDEGNSQAADAAQPPSGVAFEVPAAAGRMST
jgi:hypothetical protein